MAVKTIGGLPAGLAADLDDTALFPIRNNDSVDRKYTLAQVRTAIFTANFDVTTTPLYRFGAMVTTNASAHNFLIPNATAPTGNPTGGGFLYASSGALVWRGSSGTITTLAAA